ncbi:MAG: hypothetical protein ACRD19_11585 [Terriglobia bacterium]
MDIEKTMQFILEMQAKREIAIQRNDEQIAKVAELVAANTTRISQLVDVGLSLSHHSEEMDRRMEETGRLIKELRDAQAHSDYKLNSLIDAVEKLIRRNGSAS